MQELLCSQSYDRRGTGWFVLQFVEGDAEYWKETALADLNNCIPLLWHDDWELFHAHFKQQFCDCQEQE